MRLISSFCALACVSALPLAAVAQTAAETPAPETAPETAGRTVLDVTASGTLTGLAADALGPDAALTVRLHGPVAFDVDTADFASLEIFADDPAVKLTVSETAAYDRITAVSIPAAASGEPVAAAFTAAAASAGIATLADTAGDGGTIPNHLSVNVEGNVDEISGTSSASGLAPWRFNDSEWVNAAGNRDTTITVSEAAFKVTSVGGTWSLSEQGGMERIASQISRLGAMGDGYRDGEWTVEASNIPYDEYSLILYLATDNSGKTWSRTKLTQSGSDTYYYYADENDQRVLRSNGNDGTTWGSTTDIATDGRAAYVGRDIMVIPGLSGSSFTFNLSGTSGNTTERGGLFGFQVVKSRDIVIGDNVAAAQLSSYDTVDGKSDYLTNAFVTATIGAESTLTVDTAAFYHLKLKGPETGTATLQIAADVDFSKIDLSEATNVNIKFVAPQEGGNTPLAVTGSLQASGDVTISTPVTLTVDGADVTPYWAVGGSLTIAEGSSLTVAVAEGVTLPNPYRVIQANTISVASGGALATPDGSSYKAVLVGSDAVWVISNNSIWPVVPVNTQTWTDLRQKAWVTEGGGSVSPVQITTESSVVLELVDGATLTVNDSILNSGTVSELALRVTNGGTATIVVDADCRFPFAKTTVAVGTVRVEGAAELGAVTISEGAHLTLPTASQMTATSVSGGGVLELGPESATETGATVNFPIDIAELIARNCTISGSTLTVANQVTVAAGTVKLPKDAVFATETRGVKPVLEIAGGATAVVDAAKTTLVQRNTIRGTNANATLRVTNSSGYSLRGGETLAGDASAPLSDPLLDNVRLEVPAITASHAGDPWLRNATIAFTGRTSTWTAANWVKADGTVTVDVPEGSTVTFDTSRAFRLGKLVKTGAGTFAVKAQNIPIEVCEGRLELTWWDSGRPTDGTTVAKGAILAMDAAGTLSFGTIAGEGTIEVTESESGSNTVSAIEMAGEAFGGTLRIAEGVTKSGDWAIPCNVELNGTVSGPLTVSTGKRFGGSGTVTGQLKLENGYILKCGASADEVPLIGTEVGEGKRVFDTNVPTTGGRLWRDTAKEDFILRLAKKHEHDPAFIADSSGYVVDPFTEGDVSGLRLAAAFELDLSELRDPGKTSGTYAWNVANNWLPPAGKSGFPGDANNKDAVVRIMVPASRNVTVVIPPGTSAAVRAIQVIGMTGEAEGWKTGTLRWVEGDMSSGSDDVPSPTELTSTLTTQEIRMAGPMEITQECNVSVKSAAGWTYDAYIGSGAASSTVWVKAGTFEADNLLMENVRFTVGSEKNTAASVICDFLYLQTQSGGSGSLTVGQGGSFTPSYIHGISKQDSLELAGGTFTVPAFGMKLSDQIVVSADSTLHFAGTDPTEAILSFVADAQGVGFSGSGTLTLTGTGTLNASDAKGDSAYTGHLQFLEGNQVVCNIGQRRPAIGGAPYRIEVVRKASDEEAAVRIPLYDADTFAMPLSDANATAGVAVSDWVGTVAEIVKTETSAELVLTPLGYPQLEGGAAPGISGEAAMVLRKLANSGNSNFTVRQTTVTGKPVEFDAEGVNAALLLFTNVAKKETDGPVTVAYAFGISDITVEGDDIIVTAKVLGPEGAATAADFAKAASVDLYRDGVQSTAEPSAGTEAGTQVFKLEGALSTLEADSAATFTVKATSGVEQTSDESVPDEGTDSE